MKLDKLTSRSTLLALLTVACLPAPAVEADRSTIDDLLNQLAGQQTQLDQQQAILNEQRRELEALKAQLERQAGLPSPGEPAMRAAEAVRVVQEPGELELSGYGIVNYIGRDWDTDELARDSFDTERFILELEYAFDERFLAKAELEFEHGGTGATIDLDTQEEFGEFDQEIEKGGEILVEELFVGYRYRDWLKARFGRFYVPIGRMNRFHEPQQYFTVARSAADAAVIPQLWHESGASVFGTLPVPGRGHLRYEAQVVSGLDSTGFSSRNWIAGGHQKRFEEVRAEDLAFAARLDYYPSESLQIGGSYYGGNTVGNRPKNDLDYDAWVDILEVDGEWQPGDFTVRGQYLRGRLQNSHLVTDANRNLSNNLGVKRTPVGAQAQSWFVEAGYDFLRADEESLILFGRYEAYDSMYRTEGLVFDNPRWDRRAWTAGVNYRPIEDVILKAEYNHRTLDIAEDNEENTWALGVGFSY
jgi:hypothetical protein